MPKNNRFKKDFPIFASEQTKKNGKELVYLDSASTTQKPQSIIDAVTNYYKTSNANIHRGIYSLSEKATAQYEEVREKTAKFLNADSPEEIIFTKNTTEAINLLAYTLGEKHIKKDDEIIVSELEHHSNLVPWQEVAKRKKAKLKVIPIKSDYTLDMDEYHKLLNPKTKLVAITAMSNVLGTKTPLKDIIKAAHTQNSFVLVDGAQSAPHQKTDLSSLGCDFFTMSSHKMLGPTGVGVLYGKKELLNDMPPFLFGGDMIKSVSQYNSEYADLPDKFEAGTPDMAGVIGLGAALDYINKIGFKTIEENDKKLFTHTVKKLSEIEGLNLLNPPADKAGPVISFTLKNIHPHDIATILDQDNICLRAGHHCAQPLMEKLKLPATARISFHIYNTPEDIDKTCDSLRKAIKLFE